MKLSTKTIVTIGMFTAVLSVLSILAIPLPSGVPITLQTFAMALGGYVLGWKKGMAATLVYILLGSAGVPIFAGMSAGPSVLFGYSGGFIWGFLFLTLLCGLGMKQKHTILRIAVGLVGLFVCHLFGAVQFSVVASATLPVSIFTVSLPYLLKDIISVGGACLAAIPVRRALFAGNILTDDIRAKA